MSGKEEERRGERRKRQEGKRETATGTARKGAGTKRPAGPADSGNRHITKNQRTGAMLPSYPYPSINSLQKRSSIASERPYLHRYALSSHDIGLHSTSNSSSSSNGTGSDSSTARHGGHRPSKGTSTSTVTTANAAGTSFVYDPSSSSTLSNDPARVLGSYADVLAQNAAVYTSSYTSHFPLCGLDWAITRDEAVAKIALSSYREDSTNRLEIVYGEPQQVDVDHTARAAGAAAANSWSFARRHDYSVKYPVTRLQWDPAMSLLSTDVDRLATTSECLRIYEVIKPNDYAAGNTGYVGSTSPDRGASGALGGAKLVEKTALTNSKSKNLNQLPPMTSFDWNRFDPTSLITCSIDTTCTVWNLTKETFVAKTQLIAHDSEVYDVKYIYGDTNVFASCSSDGSVRLFDLRNLDQSTIIYERSDSFMDENGPRTAGPASDDMGKLVRLATSNYNANQIAVLEAESSRILVLDLRHVGVPLYTLKSHASSVNSIAWHPKKNMLLSGGDDCQVLVHDLTGSPEDVQQQQQGDDHSAPVHTQDKLPSYSFSAAMEVNSVCWSPDGSWVGLNSGKQFQACHL